MGGIVNPYSSLLEHLLLDTEVVGLIPSWVIRKTIKMVPNASLQSAFGVVVEKLDHPKTPECGTCASLRPLRE